jgi:hypothetical protein
VPRLPISKTTTSLPGLNIEGGLDLAGAAAKSAVSGEIRVLDEKRKRLLARNNVSVFQKSKGTSVEEADRDAQCQNQRILTCLEKTSAIDGKESLNNPGRVLSSPAPSPLKIPRPPAPRPSLPAPANIGFLKAAPPPVYQPLLVKKTTSSTLSLISKGSISVGKASEAADQNWSEKSSGTGTTALSGGHPGLPSGLMRMASSVIPVSKSPTKMVPRAEARHVVTASRSSESTEVRRARLDLLLFQPPSTPAPRTAYSATGGSDEDPPVLTPQVSSVNLMIEQCLHNAVLRLILNSADVSMQKNLRSKMQKLYKLCLVWLF